MLRFGIEYTRFALTKAPICGILVSRFAPAKSGFIGHFSLRQKAIPAKSQPMVGEQLFPMPICSSRE